MLDVKGVSKRYGETVALADASIAFRAGTIHTILGENGSGKSTLVKLLSGIVQPDAGAIMLDGRPFVARDPASFQAAGFATRCPLGCTDRVGGLQWNSFDAFQKRAAGLGQFRTVRYAVEQACADFGFQILDLLTEGRLPDPEAGRGAREIAFFGNRQEVTQVTQFHRYLSGIYKTYG